MMISVGNKTKLDNKYFSNIVDRKRTFDKMKPPSARRSNNM